MLVRVLGSAAGGGFPQWNCACRNCRGVRGGSSRAVPRTQDSIAVSSSGELWFVLNASPDLRMQIEATPALHPRMSRDTPICGVAMTNGDLDHVLGLLSLREAQPLRLYATRAVQRGLVEHNAFLRTLDRFEGQTAWHPLELGVTTPLLDADGAATGLSLTAIAVPGKPPLHLEGRVTSSAEDNTAFVVRDERRARSLVYAPGVARPNAALLAALRDADCVLFDGTFWSDDELSRLGLGEHTAARMAHWPVGGPDGSLALLAGLRRPRKLLTHINNSNPLLEPGSPERAAVAAAGVELAEDGLEIEL